MIGHAHEYHNGRCVECRERVDTVPASWVNVGAAAVLSTGHGSGWVVTLAGAHRVPPSADETPGHDR